MEFFDATPFPICETTSTQKISNTRKTTLDTGPNAVYSIKSGGLMLNILARTERQTHPETDKQPDDSSIRP